MVDMIATKRLKYGTRRLTAGDPFEARHDRDARLLIGIGKARYATRDATPVDEANFAKVTITTDRIIDATSGDTISNVAPTPADERPALRAKYEAKFGKKPFGGWSADVLREKLAAG